MTTPTLAERLRLLFENVYPGNRGPYSIKEVAASLKRSGTPVSRTAIKNISTGKTERPSFQSISALANFFGVDLDYFDTTDDNTWNEYKLSLISFRRQMDSDHLYAARKIADRQRNKR